MDKAKMLAMATEKFEYAHDIVEHIKSKHYTDENNLRVRDKMLDDMEFFANVIYMLQKGD